MSSDRVDAQTVWARLSEVEKTGLGVAFIRWEGAQQRKWPDGQPWYRDPYGRLFVDQCIPVEEQQKMAEWSTQQRGRMYDFAAVRTAELDSLIAAALAAAAATASGPGASQQPILQMVMLGAGMDTRAWRLPWPSGFSIYEVDSQAVLDFKLHVMLGAISGRDHEQQQQQQQEGAEAERQPPQGQQQHQLGESAEPAPTGPPVLQCEKRVTVAADASKVAELWGELVQAGLDTDQPILYLLEGFIGYLNPDAGNKLLSHLASSSAANSRIIMTAPPAPNIHAEVVAAHFLAKLPLCLPAFVRRLLEGVVRSVVHVLMFLGVVNGKKGGPKLHHETKEQPSETLKRMEAAGWRECRLLTSQQIAAKYGTEVAQPILVGRV